MAKGPASPKAARAAKGAAPKSKSPASPKKIKGKVQVSKNKSKVTVKFAKEDKETRTSDDLTTDPDSYDVPLYLCPTPGNSGVCMNLADDSSKSMWSESETRRTKDKTQKPAKSSGKKSPGAGKAAKGKGKASPKAQKKTGSLQVHSQCTQVSSCWARSTQTAQCLTSNASCNTEVEDKKPCSRPTQTSICVVRNACCKKEKEPCIRSDVDAERPGCSSSSQTHSTSLAALLSNVRNAGSPTRCHRSPYEKLGRAEDFCNGTDGIQELPKNDTRVGATTRCSFNEMPNGCGPRFVSKYCRSKISRCHRPIFRECLYDSDCSVPSICSEPPRAVSEVIMEDKIEPEVAVVQKPEPEEEKPLIVHVREEVVDPILDVVEEFVTGVETVVEDIPKPVEVQITVEPTRQSFEVKLDSPAPEPEVVEFKPASPEPKRESVESKRNSSRRNSHEPRRESVEVRRNSPEPRRESVEVRRNSPEPQREIVENPEPKLDYVKIKVPKPTAPILSCDYRIDRCSWNYCCPTFPRPQCFETCNFPFTDLSSRSSARSSRVSRYCDYDLEPCPCSSYRGGSRYYCKMAAAGALRSSCETKPLFKRWKWRHQFENS